MEVQHISNFLQERNSEQAMPELKRQVSGEHKKFEVALKSKFIKDCPIEEVKEILRLIMVKVGLRAQNWPNDIEKLVLFEHIRDNFGGNRVDEIRLAFEMAIAGKLDLPPNEVTCYENFSCIYFSKIMNAYRVWSEEEYRILKMPEPVEQKIFTQDELDNSEREDAERQYQMFLRGYKLKGLEFNKPILVKDSFMKEDAGVMDFFKQWAKKGYAHIYKHQQ